MQTKPWQIAIIVIGLLVGGGLTFYNLFFAGEVRLASTLTLIDVTTGEVFEVSVADKGYMAPGLHPTLRTRSLMPIAKGEDGSWSIDAKYVPALAEMKAEVKAIDKETGKVVGTVGKPKWMEHPSKWKQP